MEKLTSFDEARRVVASMKLLRTEAFTFLKPAITDIGTAVYKDFFMEQFTRKLVMGKHNIQFLCLTASWRLEIIFLHTKHAEAKGTKHQ